MQATDIVNQIQNLPHNLKFYVVEETLKSIKRDELNSQLELAVDKLYDDYVHDKELTALTVLDFENFYEAR